MRRKFDKNAEFIHFQELSNEWWDSSGKFKVLHTLTPIRIKYIKDNICLVHDNITKNNKILKGLNILDLGCGGGLVCEPLVRLGAKVTGIDFVEKNIKTAKRWSGTRRDRIRKFHSWKVGAALVAIQTVEAKRHLELPSRLMHRVVHAGAWGCPITANSEYFSSIAKRTL